MVARSGDHMALTASKVKSAVVGRHSDSGGLILRVHESGLKQWFVRVQIKGKRTEHQIGKYPNLSLAEARSRAREWRDKLKSGAEGNSRNTPTFDVLAEEVVRLLEPNWKNLKHPKQWRSTIATYASPQIGNKPVDSITSADILAILQPIWNDKRETATRVKQRMSKVFDTAVVQGYRETNPVGPVDSALPSDGRKVRHMPSMPYQEVASFIRKVKESEDITPMVKLALEFTILTASRSGETRKAEWGEISKDLWIIPAEKMKADRQHRVTLSSRCLEILEEAKTMRVSEIIFPGRTLSAMSDMTLQQLLRRYDGRGFTIHGFRTSFMNWSMENTDFDRTVRELCLAHSVGNQVEQAYARSELIDKRRELIQQWCNYLNK